MDDACCGERAASPDSRPPSVCSCIPDDGEVLLRHAGELGQALLQRHEAFVAEAQHERRRMAGAISSLETEKRDLEASNATLVDQNRHLLDQLEGLNTALEDSDAHVKSLTATLHSTQEQLKRVTALAGRTEWLEEQMAALEREQADLQKLLDSSREGERGAALREKQAVRVIENLQDQIDRIEKEAAEERQRHVEVVGRMERRRAVEKELETAAGRLKGAAAARTTPGKAGSNVVSHFVKDILQDNANLQLGIVELREMLLNSNQEVARLREQLMLNPAPEAGQEGGLSPKLRHEMDLDGDSTAQNRELHVHHHFHDLPKAESKTPRGQQHLQRRIRRKRNVVTSGHFSPPNGPRGSNSTDGLAPQTPTSAAAIISQTSVTIPQRSNRWSVQSAATNTSSLPGSPYAHSRDASSIFDRIFSDNGHESSRPTSPESSDPESPALDALNKLPATYGQLRSRSSPATTQLTPHSTDDNLDDDDADLDVSSTTDIAPLVAEAIPEEKEDEDATPIVSQLDLAGEERDFRRDLFFTRPTLRRAASHESLLSVSGMDIHTLQSRPWQLMGSSSAYAAPSLALPLSRPVVAAATATTTTEAISRPSSIASNSTDGRRKSKDILSSMVAGEQRRSVSSGNPPAGAYTSIGSKVGGWVRGRWGLMPTPSTLAPNAAADQRSISSTSSGVPSWSERAGAPKAVSVAAAPGLQSRLADERKRPPSTPHPSLKLMKSSPALPTVAEDATAPRELLPRQLRLRSPGINQPGPILGFPLEPPTPFKTHVGPEGLDEEALREGLGQL